MKLSNLLELWEDIDFCYFTFHSVGLWSRSGHPRASVFFPPKPIFKAIQHQGFNWLTLGLPNACYKMIFLTKRRNFKPNRQRKLEALRSKFHTQLKWISIECQHISNANQTFRYLTVSLLNEVIGTVGVISAVDNFSCSYVIREKIYNDRNKKPKIKQIRIKKNNSLLKKLKLESRIWKPIPKGMKTRRGLNSMLTWKRNPTRAAVLIRTLPQSFTLQTNQEIDWF